MAQSQEKVPTALMADGVDDVDVEILRHLRADARLSARAIARRIGMSPGAVSERITRLERDKVVLGYFAEVDSARLGIGMVAIVGIQAAHDSKLRDLVNDMLKIPGCERVYVVTGQWDLLVFLRVRDQHHLAEMLFSDVWRTHGFRRSETMVVLERESVRRGELAIAERPLRQPTVRQARVLSRELPPKTTKKRPPRAR